MKGYASRTGTRRNLAALRELGWGLLVSATGVQRDEGFADVILDNGAWTFFQRGVPWNPAPFERLLSKFGGRKNVAAVVAPDIVCGGLASWDLTLGWLPRLRSEAPLVLLPLQPGIPDDAVLAALGDGVGVFVGGDTEGWKLRATARWSPYAYTHVGRVNTARRAAEIKARGAQSFDGSGPSRFEKNLHQVEVGRADAVQLAFDRRPGEDLWA